MGTGFGKGNLPSLPLYKEILSELSPFIVFITLKLKKAFIDLVTTACSFFV
jgi:hypothetical protein